MISKFYLNILEKKGEFLYLWSWSSLTPSSRPKTGETCILWGDEILADMPSCLGGEDNRTNYV